ncbi:MAG: hypothetical protein ACRCWR_08835, partial [Saezia sp.]
SFMGSLSSQKEHNSYARRLLAYMQGESPVLPEGVIEIVDIKKNASYLLKVVSRVSTIERSQGSIVTLIDLSGVQQSEIQRDQILRYLHSNIIFKFGVLQESLTQGSANNVEDFVQLRKQMEGFLAFQHAQSAIYFYEKVDLHAMLQTVATLVAGENPAWEQGVLYQAGEPVIVQGDMQMLGSAFTDLLKIMVHLSGSDKMPQIRIAEKNPAKECPDLVHCAQVMLIVAVKNDELAEVKHKMMLQDVQQVGIPDEVDADCFNWWAVKAIVSRHSGKIKIQKNDHSFMMTVEFLK